MSKSIITPRTLKGFRDYVPKEMIPREHLMQVSREVYRSFGFNPIDTPALEYAEVLLGKGSDETDKQTYRFEDHGGRDVALRFDLTVPFARFAAQHIGQLGTPFKRYHIGPVWRGENTQRGRYREFVQCDFDTIGTTSLVSDTETALVIYELFRRIGFQRFTIRMNDRRVLSGLLERLELTEQTVHVLRALDKLHKIGPEKVTEEMIRTAGASPAQAQEVLALAKLSGPPEELLVALEPMVLGSERGTAGVHALGQILEGAAAAGVEAGRLALDLSIARGLDYYTGVVYETFLDELPEIGSCCSGGRYDNLAELYTKESLPGVGASLGVDRLLAAMGELGMLEERPPAAPILLTLFDASRQKDYLALASKLRAEGLAVELYPEARKLGVQLKYADRRGAALAIIVGEDEWSSEQAQVKVLASKESETVPLTELAEACKRLLES